MRRLTIGLLTMLAVVLALNTTGHASPALTTPALCADCDCAALEGQLNMQIYEVNYFDQCVTMGACPAWELGVAQEGVTAIVVEMNGCGCTIRWVGAPEPVVIQ